MLNDAMKALTTRKPIALTTTSLCSGAFTARIARTQRLHVLRVAGFATPGWDAIGRDVYANRYKTYALDVQTALMTDAEAAAAALLDGSADVAFTGLRAAVAACAHDERVRFIAASADFADAYVALAPAIAAKPYAMARFARALRENAGACYVDARALQARIDQFALEHTVGATFDARERISDIAVLSGTR